MPPYLIVTGDFGRFGGMDWANHALARHLADRGHVVHCVAFSCSEDLRSHPNVRFHPVPKPAGSYFLGFAWLALAGRRWAKEITAQGGRVIVNGGNCPWGDVNWVHYLHAAYREPGANLWAKFRAACFREEERNCLTHVRSIVTTAERNREDLARLYRIPRAKIHIIPLGTDAERFRPPSAAERAEMRRSVGLDSSTPVLGFVGALGDRRKGFDVLFEAWTKLRDRIPAKSRLVVAGAGRELRKFQERARGEGQQDRFQFLGFHRDVPRLLWAFDAVAAPSRYEPYSLAAQEALATGAPVFLSRSAGLSELYPRELADLLLDDPEDVDALAHKLELWARDPAGHRARVAPFGAKLRAYTWTHMAEDWVRLLEGPIAVPATGKTK
jgi:glycosyltransferase involved in cell wall biosynthesis